MDGQSVLAGLSPNIVMEIASRSLSFWQYQCSQEVRCRSPDLRVPRACMCGDLTLTKTRPRMCAQAIFQSLVLQKAKDRVAELEMQVKNVVGEGEPHQGIVAAEKHAVC